MNAIVAAIDGSPVSDAVLRTALALATMLELPVGALHVSNGLDGAAQAAADACGVELRIEHGDAEDEVVRQLAAPDVVVAVIGTRGTRGGAVPAGHLACRALQSVRAPILAVPPHPMRALAAPGPALVPLDGTEATADAVLPVIDLLADHGVGIIVVHTFDASTVPAFWDRPAHEADEWSREFMRRHLGHRHAPLDLTHGRPGEEIVRTAAEHDAVLVVLGWACSLAPGRAETVRGVLADCDVPVLLVPRPGTGVLAG